MALAQHQSYVQCRLGKETSGTNWSLSQIQQSKIKAIFLSFGRSKPHNLMTQQRMTEVNITPKTFTLTGPYLVSFAAWPQGFIISALFVHAITSRARPERTARNDQDRFHHIQTTKTKHGTHEMQKISKVLGLLRPCHLEGMPRLLKKPQRTRTGKARENTGVF